MKQEDVRAASARLFTEARTHSRWLDTPVPEDTLRKLHEWAKWGPTSMNCQPMRVIFAQSEAAKVRLSGCVNPGNVEKVLTAPVVAIIGQDLNFPAHLARLFPHKKDAVDYYAGKPVFTEQTALRNASLQGAYLIMAARLLGLDCGPLSGFNAKAVDEHFWAGSTITTNFLCCLGHGDATQLRPRNDRWSFEESCQIA